jgi:TrmH family RNA methyltransferase
VLENISIVLVEPQGDENVGMTARAMKNCGVTDLRLINPAPFKTRGANKWACGAFDLLANARVFKTLKEAVIDSSLVVGTSRREGKLRPPLCLYEDALAKICKRAKKNRVSLVFGREADGLSRDELGICDIVLSIPTSSLYPSLNLAQSVLLLCHDIYKKQRSKEAEKRLRHCESSEAIPNDSRDCFGQRPRNDSMKKPWPVFVSRQEILPVLEKMDQTLKRLGYDDRGGGSLRQKIIREFADLFGRGGLRRKDVNMFLGLTARIMEKVKE